MAISEKLKEYGVTETNVAKAIASYIFVGYSYSFCMFWFCYYCKPIQRLSKMLNTNWFYEFMEKADLNENTIKGTDYYRKIKNTPQMLAKSMAFADHIALKSIISPLAVPLRLWLAYKIVIFWNKNTSPTIEKSSNLENLKTEEFIEEEHLKDQEINDREA